MKRFYEQEVKADCECHWLQYDKKCLQYAVLWLFESETLKLLIS